MTWLVNLFRTRNTLATCALLAFLVLGAYLPSVSHNFVNLDDSAYVYENGHVQKGLAWDSFRWAFTTFERGFWHPITWLSLMLDRTLFGSGPVGFHLTSILLHTANALLLFLLLRQITGAPWRSAIVAALFGLHPLHVESVAWIAERKDVLSTFFMLLTLWAYAKHVSSVECQVSGGVSGQGAEVGGQRSEARGQKSEGGGQWSEVRELKPDVGGQRSEVREQKPEVGGQRSEVRAGPEEGKVQKAVHSPILHLPSPFFYVLSLLFFALGLMSKAMVVTLPFILLLLDFWPFRRLRVGELRVEGDKKQFNDGALRVEGNKEQLKDRELRVESPQPSTQKPSTLLREKLPFFALSFLFALITVHAQKELGAVQTVSRIPVADRIANALISAVTYLGQMIWPHGLAVYYPYPASFPAPSVIGAALLLLLISAGVVVAARSRPYLSFGWLWYGITLLPVIGLVQVGGQAHADRYTYIPSIGVFILLVWAAAELAVRLPHLKPALSGAAAGATVLCLALTLHQLTFWKDSEALFRHALAVTRNNDLAQGNLAAALALKLQPDEAIRHLREAVRLRPGNPIAHGNLGIALIRKRQLDEAIAQLETAVTIKPDYPEAQCNLGIALLGKGNLDKAILHLQDAIRQRPDYAGAERNLGVALGSKGRLDEGLVHAQKAVALAPNEAAGYYNLGLLLGAKGRADDAIVQYQRALNIEPENADAHNNLGSLYGEKRRFDEAIFHFQQAVKLQPGNAAARNNLRAAIAAKAAEGKNKK